MKRNGILNQELARAIAAMGHGDIMILCDAGFPIPREAWRIDLALVQGVPDLETVFRAVSAELITEKVMFMEEFPANNGPLFAKAKLYFDERDFQAVPYGEFTGPIAARAKAIVRSGDFAPWGNLALVSGVDAPRWFTDPAIKVPPFYRERLDRAKRG